MSEPLIGVGIIGAGPVTQAIHLPTLARLGQVFRVAHVMDVNPAVAGAVAEQAGAQWSTSVEELLGDTAVDVVAVCSPPQFHAGAVIAACRAGKRAVLCEKPFTVSVDEAQQIAAVSADTGVPVLVGAMHSYDPGWLAARENWGGIVGRAHTIRSSIVLPPNERFEDFATEVIGRPVVQSTQAQDPRTYPERIWNAIMGVAIHDLPLVRVFARDGEEPTVLAASFEPPFGYHIVVELGGRTVELRAAMSATRYADWTLDVLADDSALNLRFTPSYVHAGSAIATIHEGGSPRILGPFEANGYEAEWRHLAAVARGAQPAQSMASLIDDLGFALAIADAAAARLRESAVAA